MNANKKKKHTPKKKVKTNTRPIILAMVSIITVAALVFFIFIFIRCSNGGEEINDDSIVAWVDKVPITYREYRHGAISVRGSVLSSFIIKGLDQSDENFWYTSVDGETPIDKLKKEALDAAVKNKLIQVLGKEKGLVDDISYNAFLEGLDAENKRREDALANNQPIYGPQRFSEQVYFDKIISDLRAELQSKIAEETVFSHDEMYRMYEEQWQNTPTEGGWMTIIKLLAPFSRENESSMTFAKSVMDKVYERIQSGVDFDEVVDFETEKYIQRIEQTLDLVRGDQTQFPSIMAGQSLSKGDISEVYEDYSGYSILKCTGRNEVTYYTFEQIKNIIHLRLSEAEYGKIMDGMIEKAKVKTNDSVYKAIDKLLIQ